MCKVTVILTSYNHAKYIRETIDSILNQTFKDFELIIWDDASTDESWEIIQSYKDERIKAFRNEESKRGIYGINKAISEVAQGEYIAIHHSDDIWEPTKLEKQVKFLDDNTEYGAVFTNAQAVNENSELFEDKSHFYYSVFDQSNRTRHEWLNYFFYQGNALCHPSVLIRQECYDVCGIYRYGMSQLGDFDMWIRLCMKYEIYILPEKLTKFRVRDNEANSSGITPENKICMMSDHFFVMKTYFEMTCVDEIIKIFPQLKKIAHQDENVPEFLLAMVALEDETMNDVKLHGLSLLYDLMNDKTKAIAVKKLYNFDYVKMPSITVQNDIFGITCTQLRKTHTLQLYIDSGYGFDEQNSEIKIVNLNSKTVKCRFGLDGYKNIQKLRLDPSVDYCVLEIKDCSIVLEDGSEVKLNQQIQTNAFCFDGEKYFFDTNDPQIFFIDSKQFANISIKEFQIELHFEHIGEDALIECLKIQKYFFHDLKSIQSSKSWKIIQKIHSILNLFKQK